MIEILSTCKTFYLLLFFLDSSISSKRVQCPSCGMIRVSVKGKGNAGVCQMRFDCEVLDKS